jgi:superfamily II DNA/RNA helicase
VERIDSTAAFPAGGFLRLASEKRLLDDRLTVTRWRLDVGADGFDQAMAALIASAYISPTMSWNHPDAQVDRYLPDPGTTARKGDFGEILAGLLYARPLGQLVPFQRLENKPHPGGTMQGGDLLALTVDYGEVPSPVVVEVKYRATIKPAQDLQALTDSLAHVDDDYLIGAWAAGVRLMESHPEAAQAFALSAAQHLAGLVADDQPVPPHERHALIVTGHRLTDTKINEHWGTTPPVSQLHIIAVDELEKVMDTLYETAGRLNHADPASGVPALLGARRHLPGIAAPVSSTEARRAVAVGRQDHTLAVVETALWMLADWDGIGLARARHLAAGTDNSAVRGLAELLKGAARAAERTLAGDDTLSRFAQAASGALHREVSADQMRTVTADCADELAETGLADAVRYTGAAIAHRLPRHPQTLTAAAGATGANVEHVIAQMQYHGIHALWPSQAAALTGGLLDRGRSALAIKMPTSAGKTALIELLAADTLDHSPEAVVACLAPTRALVGQLTYGLRQALPRDSAVCSSYGGLDFDTEEPTAAGILTEPGVAVMTPERFDLEWRRAHTGDEHATVSQVELLIVDEAHYLTETRRGPRIELVIARALRRGIRVVLLSSQFPDVGRIANWVDGQPIESLWTPTWLERLVYFPDGNTTGYLQGEIGDPQPCLALSKTALTGPGTCRPDRRTEAAALAELRRSDGLVVLYSDLKKRVDKLVEALEARLDPAEQPDPALAALADTIQGTYPRHAALLRSGIGVHHADVGRDVRRVVERAARQGLLDYVVCTSTLLEGVDFPTRTVIAVYPPQDMGRPQVARLRNLAGRAGRAGRFTQGTLIVMLGDAAKVKTWLRAFRSHLPATRTALENALSWVRGFAREIDLLEPGRDDRGAVAVLDAIILAAIVEGAVIDGDLRASLEEHLGRTLWWANANTTTRNAILDHASQRATHVAQFVGGGSWQAAFYRAGLPVASAIALRDALVPHLDNLTQALDDPDSNPDDTLIWLATTVAPAAPELADWGHLPRGELQDSLTQWLRGEPTDAIAATHPQVWDEIQGDLEALVPWILTATIEFAATAKDSELRDLAHRRLGVARLRYGVPLNVLCDHVRRGEDRTVLAQLAAEFAQLPLEVQLFQDLDDFITARLNPTDPTPVDDPAA